MDPNKCSMQDCESELGPDSLTFEHKGAPAGGICGICLDDAPTVRVVFVKDDDGLLVPREITHIDKKL